MIKFKMIRKTTKKLALKGAIFKGSESQFTRLGDDIIPITELVVCEQISPHTERSHKSPRACDFDFYEVK